MEPPLNLDMVPTVAKSEYEEDRLNKSTAIWCSEHSNANFL